MCFNFKCNTAGSNKSKYTHLKTQSMFALTTLLRHTAPHPHVYVLPYYPFSGCCQPTRQRYRKSVMNCICTTIPIMMMMMVIILFSMIIHSCWQQLLKNWKWTESKQQTYYKNILFFSFFRFSYISFLSLSFLSFVARSELKKQFVCKKNRFGTQVPRGVCIE